MSELLQAHDVIASMREEISRLREENKRLEDENEYLKRRAEFVEADRFVLRCWLDERMRGK